MKTKLPENFAKALDKLIGKSDPQFNFDERGSLKEMSEHLDANGNNILDILLDEATSLELKESATTSEEKEFRNNLFFYSNAFSLLAEQSPELLSRKGPNGQTPLNKLFQLLGQLQNSDKQSSKIMQDYLYLGTLQKLVGSGYDIKSALKVPEFASTLQKMMQNDNYYTALITSTIVGAMPKGEGLANRIKQFYTLKYGKEPVKGFSIRNHIASLTYKIRDEEYNVLGCVANGFFCFPKYIDQTERIKPLTQLLIKECGVSVANQAGKTALMFAIEHDNVELVDALLAQDPEILNKYDALHQTPLIIAIQSRNTEMIAKLVNAGADLDIKDYLGKTALEYAHRDGLKEIETIIQDRIVLKEIGEEVLKGNAAHVLKLLEKNDNPNFKDSFGKTAFMHAIENNRLDLVKKWRKGGSVDVNAQNSKGVNALMLAINNNNMQIVNEVMKLSPNLGIHDQNGATALLYSIVKGNTKLTKTLLKAGANPNVQDNMQATPIMIAASRGDVETMGLLIENNALVTHKDSGDRTLLMYAAKSGDIAAFFYTLDKYFSINEVDQDGKTALFHAAEGGHSAMVNSLMRKGAKIDLQDKNNVTTLMHASKHGDIDLVNAIIKSNSNNLDTTNNLDGKTAFMYALEENNEQIMGELVYHGASIDVVDKNGVTSLMYAAKHGNEILIDNILEEKDGQSIDAQNFIDGTTALIYSVRYSQNKAFDRLVVKGADIHMKDNNGMNALMHASQLGNLEMVNKLIEMGADIHAKDKNGISVAQHALLHGNKDVAKSLIEAGVNIEELGYFGYLETTKPSNQKEDPNTTKHSEQKSNYQAFNINHLAQSEARGLVRQHSIISVVMTGVNLYVDTMCKFAENIISQVDKLVQKVDKKLHKNQHIQGATPDKRESFVEKLKHERASRGDIIRK